MTTALNGMTWNSWNPWIPWVKGTPMKSGTMKVLISASSVMDDISMKSGIVQTWAVPILKRKPAR